jgi:MraZ protein
MGLFFGTYINKVDRKGRVSVPSQFRAALGDESFPGIIVYPSFTHEGVVEGCGLAFLERIAAASAAQYDVFSTEQDDLNTAIYSRSHQLPWDPEGRVILPEPILAHASIADQVAFVGLGGSFQIWQPEARKLHEAAAVARIQQNKPRLILQRPEGR